MNSLLESTNRYAAASQDFLSKAYKYFEEGDLVQASEKGWGAAAEIVKAVAEEGGRPHATHRLLFQIVDDLSGRTGDPELTRLFQVASSLHINFYENWLLPDTVQRSLGDVQQLVEKLEPMLNQQR